MGEGSGRLKMATMGFMRRAMLLLILAARARVALGKRKNSQ